MNLKDICKDRDIAVIAWGESLNILKDRLSEFKDKDLCWTSINSPWSAQELLKDIEKPVEVGVTMCSEIFRSKAQKVHQYAKGGHLVTSQPMEGHTHYSRDDGNTLQVYLCLLDDMSPKRIFLFGADGYSTNPTKYYGSYDMPCPNGWQMHENDTIVFNEQFANNPLKTKVYNVSKYSKYECFERIDYDKCLDLIK